MRALILCCLVVLTTCQNVRYDFILNPNKIYEYQYEGVVNFGLGKPKFVESGVKMACRVKIAGNSTQTFSLQVLNLVFEEFNSLPNEDDFIRLDEVTRRFTSQLVKPFLFDYVGGHVNEIHASEEVSDTVVNIIRGILGFFQVTVKTTEKIYDLVEIGIHGKCQSNYAIEEDMETKHYNITQVVDINNCREKAAIYRGMATAVLNDISKQRGESVFSTVSYVYTVNPTVDGGHITRAEGLEQQYFTPFNLKGGSFKMKARKEIVLLEVRDSEVSGATFGSMKSRGNIIYKFDNVGVNIPIMMEKLDDPVPKAVELIKSLAQVHINQVDSTKTEDVMRLYQLLRAIPYEGLKTMWTMLNNQTEHRHWFLITIVEVNDGRVLKFLEDRFKVGDLDPFEALSTVLLTFNHLESSVELIDKAKEFLTMDFSQSNVYIRHTVVLAYGSLVYKHCAYNTPCPVSVVQPLLDMAVEAQKTKNEADMILALKALGNAGHPDSIKTIMRFLPGVAANPVNLPLPVLSAAVQAMRLIAPRDAYGVQDITMNLFLNKELPNEIRMLAFVILFETKPSMALVSTVVAHLLEIKEKDLHFGSFAYYYLSSCAKSKTPDNHFLSTACNVAMKILAPQFGRLSHYYSKVGRMDWFNDDFLLGTSAEAFMLRNALDIFPSEIMMKGKFYFIGRILQLIELGIRPEGIKELFGTEIPGFKGDFSFSDFQAILNVLKKWETLPDDKPVLSAYSRAFGQEFFYTDISKDLVKKIIKTVSSTVEGGSLDMLSKGISWHKTLPLLAVEARYIQATTLGLPLEISKYYQVVNGFTVNAKATVNPPQTGIMNSEVSLETDGFIGYTKDFWLFHGINTELFQCGAELKTVTPLAIPWKFETKINIKERKFELDFPPLSSEIELFSINSNIYAVSRSIEGEGKMTPMIPDAVDANGEVAYTDAKIVRYAPELMCIKSNIYGVGVCMESELRRDYSYEEYPLYYILGYTRFALKVVKDEAASAVNKIHFEVNGRDPMCQLFNTLQKKLFQEDLLPESCFNIKAYAMSGNQQPEGYEADMVYNPDTNLIDQLIVSHIGVNTNWKMIAETTVNEDGTKITMMWGADCKPYEISVKAGTAHPSGSKPTFNATLAWKMIPETLAKVGRRIGRYIPHVTFLLGFDGELETNTEKQVSASVAAASADYIDVKIKFPKYTAYHQDIPFPLSPANFQMIHYNTTNKGFGRA